MVTEHPDERAIFNEAAEIQSPEERKAYLDTTCGDDAKLRTAVEELLRLHEANGRFLDVPVLASKTTRLTSTVSAGPGDLIGRYKLLQQIGEGGFGVVYMAEQVRPVRRRVALKIIKPGMDTNAVIARFEAERQALAMMEHPNIARALDAGATEAGRPYFVMELVKGIPITDYCDRNHLGTKERLDLFTQVCSAVQHAHQKGIIHRDLKPSNVLVTLHNGAPVPKVIDFGIAKATDQRLTERTLFTAFGQFMGTPQYMSPEQAEMSALDFDTRSDVYSLGVLLYELLTGTTPFEGARLRAAGYDEVCRIIREVEPPRPSTRISTLGDQLTDVAKHRRTEPAALGKLVRGDLDWIVMKALEKDRSRRYKTATGLAEDIQRHLSDEPVIAGPPGAAYRLRKFVRRNRATVMAGAVVAAALVLGLSLATVGFVRAETARKTALEAKAEAETAREAEGIQRLAAEEFARQLEREGYFLRVSVAAKEIEEGNLNRARELLEGCQPEMRHWEWYWLQRLCHQDLATLKGHTGAVMCVAFSPDGKYIVSGGIDGTIRLWDGRSGQQIRTMEGGLRPRRRPGRSPNLIAFSPDGRWIASGGGDDSVRVWDARSGREVLALEGHLGEVMSVAFSPDGKRLASGGGDKTLKVWDLESGKEIFAIKHPTRFWVGCVSFSPDGNFIATGAPANLCLWDAHTGRQIWAIAPYAPRYTAVTSVAFSPDGKKLVTSTNGGTGSRVKVWDTQTGEQILALASQPNSVRSAVFSPDGKYIAFGGGYATVRLCDAENGWEIRRLKGHTGPVWSVAFSPDGKHIVSGGSDRTVKIWEVQAGDGSIVLDGRGSRSVAFSPAGKLIAAGSHRAGTANIWALEGGREAPTLQPRTGGPSTVAFSPDGKRLVSGGWDKTVGVWDVQSGRKVMALEGHSAPVSWVAFSPDGERIASASSPYGFSARDFAASAKLDGIKIWDAESGREITRIKERGGGVNSFAFSPGGKLIASAHMDNTVRIWDAESGAEVSTLPGHLDIVLAVAFSPDGRQIASGGSDGSIKLWDAESGREVLTFLGHARAVYSLAFSPDGRRIASASLDRMVKLWDVESGREVLTLKGRAASAMGVAFSPGGRWIASGGWVETVRLWDAGRSFPSDGPGSREDPGDEVHRTFAGSGYVQLLRDRSLTLTPEQRLVALTRIIDARPRNVNRYLERGRAHAELGKFEKAALDFARVVELKPHDAYDWYLQALAESAGGDTEGYRKTCASMLESFGHTEDPGTAKWIAWTCVLAPDALEDPGEAVRLAEKAVESDNESDFYRATLGAALYRAGRFEEAVKRLGEQGARWDEGKAMPTQTSPAYVWFFLAMAHHQEGHFDEAQKWLKKAVARAEQEMRGTPSWNRQLTLKLLRQEAESLLGLPEQTTPDEKEVTPTEDE